MIELINVNAGYSKSTVLKDVNLNFKEGEVTAVLGSNGSGKSTLLKLLAGRINLLSGEVKIDGKDLFKFSGKTLARKVSVLPQIRNVPSMSCEMLVSHGRFPYLTFPRKLSETDKEIIAQSMEKMDVLRFKNQNTENLSGGERQRVYIAMMLAQQGDIMLFDEPTTYLDTKSQFDIISMIASLKEKEKTVVAVLHDIISALTIADKIVYLDKGKVIFNGNKEEFIRSKIPNDKLGVLICKDKDNTYYLKRNV